MRERGVLCRRRALGGQVAAGPGAGHAGAAGRARRLLPGPGQPPRGARARGGGGRGGARQGRGAGRAVCCVVQVSLDGDPARGGATAVEVPRLADAVAAEPGLVLGGVVAGAPRQEPRAAAFARLAEIAAVVRAEHPEAVMISAGMSGDMEEAIAAGATHVRVGTALLGGRPAFVG